jgi:hypothetical protein
LIERETVEGHAIPIGDYDWLETGRYSEPEPYDPNSVEVLHRVNASTRDFHLAPIGHRRFFRLLPNRPSSVLPTQWASIFDRKA